MEIKTTEFRLSKAYLLLVIWQVFVAITGIWYSNANNLNIFKIITEEIPFIWRIDLKKVNTMRLNGKLSLLPGTSTVMEDRKIKMNR